MQANDPEVFKRRKIDLGMIQFNGPVAMYNLWEFHNIEICVWCLLVLKRNQCQIVQIKAKF